MTTRIARPTSRISVTGRTPGEPNVQHVPGCPADRLQQRQENPTNFTGTLPFVDYAATEQSVSKAIDMAPSKKLKDECIGCRVTFGWFSTTRMVDKTAKQDMASAVDSTEEGFSASKRLMDSRHPSIKEANELHSRVNGYWKSCTIPLAAFANAKTAANKLRPEPGVRLIDIHKVAEFDERMTAFIPEVKAMEKKLNDNLPDIKRMDQERLKGLYREEDYPKQIAIEFSWGFPAVDVPAVLERLAPRVFAKEAAQLHERMEDTYELATTVILTQMHAVVKRWVDSLGPVTRIYPPEHHPCVDKHGAEIREEQTHAEDPAIPAGKRKLLVRFYPDKSKVSKDVWLGPFTAAEYADLRPSQVAGERRKFQDTTIEAMGQMLQQFHNVQGIASPSAELQEMVKTIESQLAKCKTIEATAKELRNSETFRAETHKLMTAMSAKLGDEIEAFGRKRRKVTYLEDAAKPAAE